jgi:hypothetical protein
MLMYQNKTEKKQREAKAKTHDLKKQKKGGRT